MTDIEFRSDVAVQLVKQNASDNDVLWAARVSTQGERVRREVLEDKRAGLINYLMRDRHGCYDDRTDVLTADGWKPWPEVDGTESFVTLNLRTNVIEYQRAQRRIHADYAGQMVHIRMAHVDALVTPDHNMVAAPRTHDEPLYGLHAASEFLKRSHRVRLGGGVWGGSLHCPWKARLIGFIVADGHVGSSVEFHLRRSGKVKWLTENYDVTRNGDTYRVVGLPEDVRKWAKETYTETGDRCFPRELLLNADAETLTAMLGGYLDGDGSRSDTVKWTCSTVSRQLVDDLQELALKCGVAAVENASDIERRGAFGTRPVFRLTIYRPRNMQPRVGWTKDDREKNVTTENYTGTIHCVTVPNGTLYVRRNGKPMWSGNSPFEHNSMTFFISAPIFVFREFMRHRVGWSYNEESGRYRELEPVFYIPGPDRKLVQEGRPGKYVFVDGPPTLHGQVVTTLMESYDKAYWDYQKLLEAGVAREVARSVLPVGLFSSMYATCNARSLMHFLGLRTQHELAKVPSFPQREIEMVGEKMEAEWARLMPLTYAAFNANGRIAP